MRKQYLIIVASLLLLLLVACAPLEKQEDANTTKESTADQPKEETKKQNTEKQTVDEKVVEPKKETAPTDKPDKKESAPLPEKSETKTKQTTKELPAEIKELISKADAKLSSMVYLYGSPENKGRFLDTYYVRGNKIKVKLYEDNYYVEEDYFDTVYLDTSDKTATGRCENRRRCLSSQMDNTGKIFSVKYEDYRRKTPYEWLQEIKTAEMVGPEIVDKRSAQKIKYSKDEYDTEMWLDKTYGVPLQIKISYPNEEEELYQFTNVQFNTLKEEDVTPAFLVEQQSPQYPDAPVN